MEREQINMEIWQLTTWFDTYYAQHEQKYNRLIALDRLTDNGENPHDKLIELYETAETNRKRIQELESLIN